MSQHNIVGSEAFQRAPFVYIRAVRPGTLRRRRARTAVAFFSGAALAAAVGAGALIVAFGSTLA